MDGAKGLARERSWPRYSLRLVAKPPPHLPSCCTRVHRLLLTRTRPSMRRAARVQPSTTRASFRLPPCHSMPVEHSVSDAFKEALTQSGPHPVTAPLDRVWSIFQHIYRRQSWHQHPHSRSPSNL